MKKNRKAASGGILDFSVQENLGNNRDLSLWAYCLDLLLYEELDSSKGQTLR